MPAAGVLKRRDSDSGQPWLKSRKSRPSAKRCAGVKRLGFNSNTLVAINTKKHRFWVPVKRAGGLAGFEVLKLRTV